MKATISAEGLLVITSESELESYSLGKWSDDLMDRKDIPNDIPICIVTFKED